MIKGSNILVSVVVPVYKVENYIENCLNSLINQTYNNWEAILVDDGSPDSSGEICENFAAKDKRFKVIHKQNGGLSSARNAGLSLISGDYVFYLDSDDFIEKSTFESLVQLAIQYNADIVQCGFLYGTETTFPQIGQNEEITVYDNKSIFTKFKAKIVPHGKLYRKRIVDSILFPTGYINEDDFTVWKYYYRSEVIVITNQPYYYYTFNPNGIMSVQRCTKSPDLRYFKAYEERISFFIEKNEKELEAVSRIQWMKSLVILASNQYLTPEQKDGVLGLFKSNYSALKILPIKVPFKISVLFRLFLYAPNIFSKIAKHVYMNS